MTTRFVLACSVCAIAMMAMMPLQARADNNRGHNNGIHDNRGNNAHVSSGSFAKIQQSHAQKNFVVRQPYYHSHPKQIVRYVPQPVYYPHYQTRHPYIGRRLVHYTPVPYSMMGYLQPAPRGYYYSMADQNVFMVSSYDNTIVQIISMLLR